MQTIPITRQYLRILPKIPNPSIINRQLRKYKGDETINNREEKTLLETRLRNLYRAYGRETDYECKAEIRHIITKTENRLKQL